MYWSQVRPLHFQTPDGHGAIKISFDSGKHAGWSDIGWGDVRWSEVGDSKNGLARLSKRANVSFSTFYTKLQQYDGNHLDAYAPEKAQFGESKVRDGTQYKTMNDLTPSSPQLRESD
jgi:hypothetical protein